MSFNISSTLDHPLFSAASKPSSYLYCFFPSLLSEPVVSRALDPPSIKPDQPIIEPHSSEKHADARMNIAIHKHMHRKKSSRRQDPVVARTQSAHNTDQFPATSPLKQHRLSKRSSFEKSSSRHISFEQVEENASPIVVSSIAHTRSIILNKARYISGAELIQLLNPLLHALNQLSPEEQDQHLLPFLADMLDALFYVPADVLLSIAQNDFFTLLREQFTDILKRWSYSIPLTEPQLQIFRHSAKLLQRWIDSTNGARSMVYWLSDPNLVQAIAQCFRTMATGNQQPSKDFVRLIDTYILYQQQLDAQDQDKLLTLFDSLLGCLTSSHYFHYLSDIKPNQSSMSTIEKFFLIKCPTLLISYTGSRWEELIRQLLSTMLPRYVTIFDKHVPSVSHWNRPILRAIIVLIQMINHGSHRFPTISSLISEHLPLIDHILTLVDSPVLYKNIRSNLSNFETELMHVMISFLVNMITNPAILSHVKQSQVTERFLRLTPCDYEPLVLNVYTLLAFTMREEDVQAMPNAGRLLYVIIDSLKKTLIRKPEKQTNIEQLLETLKGLLQHDQIKDETIKQNVLPFILECANTFSGRALVFIFQILWSLTFFEEIARALRSNTAFITRIETLSKETTDPALKKAIDGLVWKLLQESASLEKISKQEEVEEVDEPDTPSTPDAVTDIVGQNRAVQKKARFSPIAGERIFQYDIMISYCHADKELTYKIHKFLLNQGFKVWIDLDNMYGPAMSAMADAVENSEFVIMCMSDSYKQSTYCQAEAEYAFKCKRRLIPLIMRPGYRPDGWLGFMIGSRIYIDFGRYDFDTACEKLMTEIRLQRRQTIPDITISSSQHVKPDNQVTATPKDDSIRKNSLVPCPEKKPQVSKDILTSVIKARQSKLQYVHKPLKDWNDAEVADFLLTQRLNPFLLLCDGMDGRSLIQLYNMCLTHSLRAYSVLKDELRTTHNSKLSVGIYSRFLSAIEDVLTKPVPPPPPAVSITKTAPPPPPPPFSQVEVSSGPRPTPLSPVVVTTIPFYPASNLDLPYDFTITSNASPFQTLKMVERFSSQLQLLDHLRRRMSQAP